MEAKVHHNVASDMMEIYVSDGKYYRVYGDREEYFEAVPGQEIKPYLRLPVTTYQAIMRAALGPTPTDDVVRDTRNVRDRMIALVEFMVKAEPQTIELRSDR
jgi:hypothetical protein